MWGAHGAEEVNGRRSMKNHCMVGEQGDGKLK